MRPGVVITRGRPRYGLHASSHCHCHERRLQRLESVNLDVMTHFVWHSSACARCPATYDRQILEIAISGCEAAGGRMKKLT